MMLSSYIADIPETEDMLFVNRRTQSTSLCHNFVMLRLCFGVSSTWERKALLPCQNFLLDQEDESVRAAGEVTDISTF